MSERCQHIWETFKGTSGLTLWRCTRCDARSLDKPSTKQPGK